jgi:DNA-binding transcriptional ArsR family regulator
VITVVVLLTVVSATPAASLGAGLQDDARSDADKASPTARAGAPGPVSFEGSLSSSLGGPRYQTTAPQPIATEFDPAVLSAELTESAIELGETIFVDRPSGVVLASAPFTRYDRADLPDNENRRAIYDAVSDAPGGDVGTIADRVDLSPSTVRYHTRMLAREDVLRTEKHLGKRRLYPTAVTTDGIGAALSDDSTAPLLQALQPDAELTVSELSEKLDRAPSTISYHVSRLEDQGVLNRDRHGESVLVSLTPPARSAFQVPFAADD